MVRVDRFLNTSYAYFMAAYPADSKPTKIWNTYAAIPGHISDEVVFIGNHRDGTYTILAPKL